MTHTDLHIHSQYSSDGEFAVGDILAKCVEGEISLFSMTDHNSVRGLDEAVAEAVKVGIGFVPGIEIDCNFEGTDLHVLGYGIDWTSRDFAVLEQDVSIKVRESFAETVDKLNRLGFSVDMAAVLAAANGRLPTLELVAEVMLSDPQYDVPQLDHYRAGGVRGDMPYINFYLDYGAQGKPAFVPVEYMSYRDALAMIRDNGGVPVVAHPGLNLRGRERVVEKLLDLGAAGLEVFNNYHDEAQIAYFAPLVRLRRALMTCGSDFHGKTKPLIAVGQFRFDDRFAPDLEASVARLAQRS